MGTVEVWLAPAGAQKTSRALQELDAALRRDWRGVRYLVPTVDHKLSIERLLLEQFQRGGLLGDPLTTFYDFAREVAQRAGVHGRLLSELQKHLLLMDIVRGSSLARLAPAAYLAGASHTAGSPSPTRRVRHGFVQALGAEIDELKVHMIKVEVLEQWMEFMRRERPGEFAEKLGEIYRLYKRFQDRVIAEDVYDNEGLMWIAAERLRTRPELFSELQVLILDGFARLTPIQVDFLRALAPRVERVIVLFDHEEDRELTYNPVNDSRKALALLEEDGQRIIERRIAPSIPAGPCQPSALASLRRQLFQPQATPCPCDESLALFIGATPAHEAELLAREVRRLLREKRLPNGDPVSAADIAILARNAGAVRERLARTFARYHLPFRADPPPLAHTAVGRAMLAAFRLVRDGWAREDVLTLLKSGFLPIPPETAFTIDLTARTHYLRERKSTWLEQWPEAHTQQALCTALAPLAAFDERYRHERDAQALMAAIEELVQGFRATALPAEVPLPDRAGPAAAAYLELDAAFTRVEKVLTDLRGLGTLLGGFRREELLEIITTALTRETMPAPPPSREEVVLLSANATGGEKFKVVFLCNLLEGAFPQHQRSSAFLLDHERETYTGPQIPLDPRHKLEDDEPFWFLHALSSATHRLVLSYPQHDTDGQPLERSSFLDEVGKVIRGMGTVLENPATLLKAGSDANEELQQLSPFVLLTSFRDVTPALERAESDDEFLAALVLGLRTDDGTARARLAAAYSAYLEAHGAPSPVGTLFRRIADADGLLAASARAHLGTRDLFFSASELQAYQNCPFAWFAAYCLGVEPVVEEFSPFDRGLILHRVLETLYRRRQQRPGEPVHLDADDRDALWEEMEHTLRELLTAEPRFFNRPKFLQDIEEEGLRRMLRRFLDAEISRAQQRHLHPAFFEQFFGAGKPLALGSDPTIYLRGKIDRVDICDDDPSRAVVIDYKTSARMAQKDLEAGKILQAPVYALALERVLALTALGAEFMGIKQGKSVGIYQQGLKALYQATTGMKELDPAAWALFLARCEAQMCDSARHLLAGAIPRQPSTKDCPDRCAYFAICRGERYALLRALNQPAKAEETAGMEA